MKHKVYTDFWKKIGVTDPYFGVLTHEEYRSEKLDDNAKEAFYQSGQIHVDRVMKIFGKIWPEVVFPAARALDFGCGTGRVSLALGHHFDEVVGVDVSAAMLKQARASKLAQGSTNVTFQEVPGSAPFLEKNDEYDYLHAMMVFQHIPPAVGLPVLEHLLEHLKPGGRAFIQLTYNNLTPPNIQKRQFLNFTYPFLAKLLGRKKQDYAFPMFDYDLNKVFAVFQRHQVSRLYQIFGASGNHQFVKLYLKKKSLPGKAQPANT